MKVGTSLVKGDAGTVVRDGAKALRAMCGEAPSFVMAFASTKQPLAEVVAGLQKDMPNALVLGSSTSGEFTEEGDAKGATALFGVAGGVKAFAGFASWLAADPEGAVKKASAQLPKSVDGFPHRTAIVLLDALSGVSE